MDWAQVLLSLGSGTLGGVLVILGDRLRLSREAKSRRAEVLVKLYTEFLVAFQNALRSNEVYWSGMAFQASGHGTFTDTPEVRAVREKAESVFRDAAWVLRLRERDPLQQRRIEAIVRAFDDDRVDFGGPDSIAFDFPEDADALRTQVREIVDRMQSVHRRILELV